MNPSTKEHNLKVFNILGLFGDRDVSISFDKNIKIFIGENGLGKTSILNGIYYTLTADFSKLSSLVFKKIIVEFNSGVVVEIDKDDLIVSEEEDRIKGRFEFRAADLIEKFLNPYEKDLIRTHVSDEDFRTNKEINSIIKRLERNIPYPAPFIRRALINMFSGRYGKIEAARRTILKELEAEILYFPTYRRIEEELHKLGLLAEIKYIAR
jgi:hypothetical protein